MSTGGPGRTGSGREELGNDRVGDGERREFGEGVLGRATALVYWHLVVELLLVVAVLPGALASLLLERTPGNAVLFALCLLPVGPAVSAGLFALRDRTRAEGLTPAASFWRGYRLNWKDALKVWVPALAAGVVVVLGLANVGAGGVPGWYAGVLVVVGAGLALWTVNALLVVSFFGFRTRDVVRLAAHYLGAKPLVTLGSLSLLVLAGGIVVLTTEAVFALVAVVWLALVLRNAGPVLADVEARFTDAA
ncbi:hypothetical protein GCM10010413_40880 [Promicromonospora sukumoe]|uniref:Membrane protein YesL n=1 Tax=Promicromonospora sukumoe TaxID=88382 RepID=A0A7W3JE81_9MICO|nr:YesL family protein [Promicromonospora sukumoe]MBA8811205.1 hypothetical protein [Promicromonospora sukumoe]